MPTVYLDSKFKRSRILGRQRARQNYENKDQLNNYYSLVRNFDKEFNKSVRETKLYLYFPLLDEKVEIVKEV